MSANLSRPALLIRVSGGAGHGPTRIAAFDAALREAGVGNFNLVRLSSVIPGGATVRVVKGKDQIKGDFGDALFTVYAEAHTKVPGEQVWAGVGWALRTDGSGAGLFVEHSGASEDIVEAGLTATLTHMTQARFEGYELAGRRLSSTVCTGEPVSAVVVATYRTMGWSGDVPVRLDDAG